MNKKVIFFIVAAVVLIGGAIAAYFLFFQDDGSDTPDTNPGRPDIDPNSQPVNIPGKGSTLITSGAVGISAPGFGGMNEGNINSYNVLKSPGSNPVKIHFKIAFNQACDPWIWYGHWLYSFVESIQDNNTGEKTCYYAIIPAKLPAELLVEKAASGSCTNFKLYLSGVEYKYAEDRLMPKGTLLVSNCVYKK